MFRFIIIAFFLFQNIYATETKVTKEWLNEKPKSHIKDFYLWRYIEQNQNDDDIIWALSEANNANHKIFIKYSKKTKDEASNFVISCSKLPTNELLKTDGECLNIGLSILEATNIKGEQLSAVIEKIKTSYLQKNEKLSIINAKEPFQALLESSSNEVFFGTFNEVGESFRVQYFNAFIPQKMISKLQIDTPKFQKMIKTIVTTPQITTIQQSLFDVDTKKIDFTHTFFLAMNAIKHDKKEIAIKYLDIAKTKAYLKFDKDNVLFWQYKLTSNKSYLVELANSWDINIYSVLAKDELGLSIDNAIFDFNLSNENSNTLNDTNQSIIEPSPKFDTTDPFLWRSVLNDIKVDFNETKIEKYRKMFNTKETLGHRTILEEKLSQYRIGYFPNPFEEHIKDYSLHRQALINAIARQESRFVQSALSSSYAMGVMQIMPFLSEAIAKELNEPYDISKQLEAKTNIRYANHHLNYLEAKLANVLFVAYAYNGGIGFTNRMLQSGLFAQGPYEPYLSMELIAYDESKHYGKKVLLNYLMYYNNLSKEKKIKLSTLLETIKSPYLNLNLSTPVK
jgi:soluble lytic murein transglycosylase